MDIDKYKSIEDIKKDIPKKYLNRIIFIEKNIFPIKQNNFVKLIGGHEEVKKLDNLIMSNKCLLETSLYKLSEPDKLNGFNIRKIKKGTNIYKSFPGFITENMINEYIKSDYEISFLSNKYLCYYISKINYHCLVSFKLKEDLILLDYFDIHNLKIIYNLLPNKLKYTFKNTFGFNVSLAEQIIYLLNKWDNVWITPHILKEKNTLSSIGFCNSTKSKINPISKFRYYLDLYIFKNILAKHNIDGTIGTQVKSILEPTGVWLNEEIILKLSTFKKLKFDYDDSLCWVNWKLNFKIPKDGFALKTLDKTAFKMYLNNELPNNFNFNLIKFYLNNNFNFKKINGKYIITFNVHNFTNLNFNISRKNNLKHFLNFIRLYKNNINIGVFQEVQFYDDNEKNEIKRLIKILNFNIYITDGNSYNNIMIISKKKLNINIIDIILNDTEINNLYNSIDDKFDIEKKVLRDKKKCIIINSEYGNIACVHLHIGFRKILSKNIDNINSKLRIITLKKILKYNPDIIIGDFNFSKYNIINKNLINQEYQYLLDSNYINNNKFDINTTPYNTVDYIWIKKNNNLINKNNFIVKTNISDHLPVFQEL